MRQWPLVVAVLALGAGAGADGVFIPAPSAELTPQTPRQEAVIVRCPDGREMLVLQPTYYGPPGEFAWIVPVPGLPAAGDVQAGVQPLLTACLETTKPLVRTSIRAPGDWGERLAEFPGTAGIPSAASLGVVVHAVIDVGKYRAAILSGTGAQGLLDWLHAGGFPVPARFASVLQDYLDRHWYFVAFKLRATFGKDRVGTMDLEPVAIIFRTSQLVYPLSLTRLGSAPWLSLLLAVVDDQPATCATFPVVWPQQETRLPLGSNYGTYRRQVISAHPEGVLLREAVWRLIQPRPADASQPPLRWWDRIMVTGLDMPSAVLDAVPFPGPTKGCLTRFYTDLPREKLTDLVFTPDPSAPHYLTLVRRAARPAVPWQFWLGDLRVCLALGLLLVAGLVLDLIGWTRRARPVRRLAALAVGTALALVPLVAWSVAVITPPRGDPPHPRVQLQKEHEEFTGALDRWTKTFGAYPSSLAQLAEAYPRDQAGQDAAGNPVTLPAKRWQPFPIPPDPLTGRADTWILDPLDPEIVSSGGFQIRVSAWRGK